jgi:hypothetical protein
MAMRLVFSAGEGVTGVTDRPNNAAVSLNSVTSFLVLSDSARCRSNSFFSSPLNAPSA